MNPTAGAVSLGRRRSLEHGLDVLAVLVSRDLKLLYKRSALGFGWALLHPLIQVCVFVLIFRGFLGGKVENYASYVFIGVLVWGWFQTSLAQSTSLITSSRALLRQPRFPLSLLPLVTVAVRLFHFSLALPILVALLWMQGIRPTSAWLGLPLLIAIQFALITAFALPLAALNVRVRDTQHFVGVTLQLAMYLTPVFYSIDSLPARLGRWLEINPVVPLLEGWRSILLRGEWPDPGRLGILACASAVLLVLGHRIFVHQSRRFVEEL